MTTVAERAPVSRRTRGRRSAGWTWRRVVVRVALGLVALWCCWYALTLVQVWRSARTDRARPADAIVVLGAAQYDGTPSPVLAARLDHAVALWQDGIAPIVVVTGGRSEGDRFTEATAAAAYLHDRGLPDAAILRETTGRSTWESLAATARFLRERAIDDVVLVTDPFHAERVAAVAGELGLDAATSPTRTSPIGGTEEWRRMAEEAGYVAIGRVIGFRRLEGIIG